MVIALLGTKAFDWPRSLSVGYFTLLFSMLKYVCVSLSVFFHNLVSVEWCLWWPCCLFIFPLSEQPRKEGVQETHSWQVKQTKKGRWWQVVCLGVVVVFYRDPTHLHPPPPPLSPWKKGSCSTQLSAGLEQLWRGCFQSSCLILPPGSTETHKHAQGEKERDR